MTSYRPSSKKGHETEMRTRQRHRHRQNEERQTKETGRAKVVWIETEEVAAGRRDK